MSKKIEVKRFKQVGGLAEIGQSMGCRFSLLSKTDTGFEERTPQVKCRDFLCDCFSATLQKYDFSIYGMSWKGSKDTLDWDGIYMILKFPDKTARESFEKNLHRLHAIEEQNGVTLTKVTELNELEFVVEGNPIWIQNVLTFSLYTLLLRVFCYKLEKKDWIEEFSKQSHSDSKYIKDFPRKSLDTILKNLLVLKTEDWNGLSYSVDGTSAVHHNSGIISVFSKHSEKSEATVRKNKHWKYYQEIKLETLTKPA